MESKYAHLQKPSPPPHRRASRKCITILLVYNALLITATVAMVALFNSGKVVHFWKIHHYDMDQPGKAEQSADSMKMYDMKVGDVSELVGIDPVREVEVINQDHFGSQIITVLEFKKSLGTFYVAEWGECYMIGGLDDRFRQPSDLVKALEDTIDHQFKDTGDVIAYVKAEDRPITDKSIVPSQLHGHCQDKPTFWLRQTTLRELRGGHRYKRGLAAPKSNSKIRICLDVCVDIKKPGNE